MLKATLIGNLGNDPDMRYSANGSPLLRFNVASNYRTRTPEGEYQDKTEWVDSLRPLVGKRRRVVSGAWSNIVRRTASPNIGFPRPSRSMLRASTDGTQGRFSARKTRYTLRSTSLLETPPRW